VGVEPKLDGVRVNAVRRGNEPVRLVSRAGKPFDNFLEIEEALNAVMPADMMIDGEICSQDFQMLMLRAKAKRGVANHVPVHFVVWDSMSVAEFDAGESEHPQRIRTEMTRILVEQVMRPANEQAAALMKLIEHTVAVNETELLAATIRHVAEGYEGSIIKKLDEPYRAKRNQNWLKCKAVLTADLVVVGMEELMLKGYFKQDGTLITEEDYTLVEAANPKLSRKEIRERVFSVTAESTEDRPAGIMGCVHCEGEYDGKRIRSKVGSGFSNEWRKWFWENRDAILQRKDIVVEVQFQELTQAVGATDYSLRFPTFLRLREDKNEGVGA
jgi:ATP-dependent DNA ligase